MYMVMCVVDDATLLRDVLASWGQAGIRGATILPSKGMHRQLARLKVPQRYVFEQQAEDYSEDHYTIFSVVLDEEAVRTCLTAAEKVVGDFTLPHTGIFTSWPLGITKGITDKQRLPKE
ncbi:MAG: hypothetical protein ACYC6L_08345 [Anaerolineae bacterium]